MNLSRLAIFWNNLRASYWFIPSVMVLAAIALSVVMAVVDTSLDPGWLGYSSFLFQNQPEGARAVLSAIAGSMITVAGVTFSMTIVAVSFAAAQFGPRLIGNFMRDIGNQITLGVFIATFAYCLMVLRSVRNGTTGLNGDVLEGFVPHASILVALVLALACIAVLIYFIHHIPETISIGNITAAVGRDLKKSVDDLFPKHLVKGADSEGAQTPDAHPANMFDNAYALKADFDGHVQAISSQALVELSIEHDAVIRLEYRPGDFVCEGDILLYMTNVSKDDEAIEKALRQCFAYGREKTPEQNLLFQVDELVEIMARALSPGVNDPFTAFSCINWLRSALSEMARRDIPSAHRYDDDKKLRVIAHPVTFEKLAAAIFEQSIQYVSADRNASLEMMRMCAEVALTTDSKQRQDILLGHAKNLAVAGHERLPLQTDKDLLQKRYEQTVALVDNSALQQHMRDNQGWLGGSG